MRFDGTMRVVVLCDNNGLGQVVLDSLHANGVKAWLIYTRAAQSLRYSRSTTPVMAVDGTLAMHADAIAGLINDMHSKQPIDMVLSPDVKGAFVLCDIQWRYYLYCQKLGLPVPKTLYFGTPAIDVAKVGREMEIADLLVACDVVVLPYIEASQSGVAASAYAAGRPVVAMPIGGLVEQVIPHTTGILAQSVSAEALANAIQEFVENPALFDHCAQGALAYAQGSLSWQHSANGQ